MPPEPKKHGLFCRFVSFFRRRGGIASADDHGGRFRPAHASAPEPVPDLSRPVDNSTHECHDAQSPIRQSNGEKNAVESSQLTATLRGGSHRLPQPQFLVPRESRIVHGGTSFLASASQFRVGDPKHFDHVTVHTGGGGVGNWSRDGWERLLESIAPDALHNSKTRQNAPKCDGDTHVKVTGEIMDWIQERNAPQRILCLKGAAGAGKSTPQQTLEAGQRSLSRQHQYPKTSSDFLNAESRAKALVVSESRVVTHLTKCCMQRIIESPLDFNCLPARWDELPLPLLSRESLREAIDNLPFLLNEAVAVDDEVSGFTRNGGWQKISKLVPLMCHLGGSYFIFSDRWINVLGEYTDKLRPRNPEIAATIREFVAKWKRDRQEWTATVQAISELVAKWKHDRQEWINTEDSNQTRSD